MVLVATHRTQNWHVDAPFDKGWGWAVAVVHIDGPPGVVGFTQFHISSFYFATEVGDAYGIIGNTPGRVSWMHKVMPMHVVRSTQCTPTTCECRKVLVFRWDSKKPLSRCL